MKALIRAVQNHPFYKKHRHFLLYVTIAALGVLLDYGSFLVLFNLFSVDKQIAQIIGAHIGFINNFLWNAFLNFKQTDRLALRFLGYYFTSLAGIGLRAIVLFIFVDKIGFNANSVQFFAMAAIALLQFAFNKAVTFRASKNPAVRPKR
jgi:putative flippase GtrA